MSRRKNRTARKAAQAVSFSASRQNLPAQARTLIADARNDITIPYYSGVLQHVDDTLIQQGGGKGLALYDEIERDTHAFSMLQKRRKGVTARAWEVEPGGDRPIDQEAADLVRKQLTALPFDRITEDLLGATLRGFAVSEVVWERDGAEIRPSRVKSHTARRFVFGEDWRPRLLTWTDMRDGMALPDRKFIVHRVGVQGNNPYGLGLGTRLFWAVLFKREGVAFWLHFLEKFAGPTVVGKTPYGMLAEDQTKLLQSLERAVTASAITVPIGTDVNLLEATRSGSVTYEQWLNYWDRQISICVTGETLTTQVSEAGGSRALGEVHQEVMDLLVDSDGDEVSETLRETLIRWIVEYNLPGAAIPNVWRVRPKNERAAAETRSKKAEAAEATDKAIRAIVRAASNIEDEAVAREYIVSFEITDQLSDQTIDALVAARHDFAGDQGDPDPMIAAGTAAFAAPAWLKKKA